MLGAQKMSDLEVGFSGVVNKKTHVVGLEHHVISMIIEEHKKGSSTKNVYSSLWVKGV